MILNLKNLTLDKLSSERPDLIKEIKEKNSEELEIDKNFLQENFPDLVKEIQEESKKITVQAVKQNKEVYSAIKNEVQREEQVNSFAEKLGVDLGSAEDLSAEEKLQYVMKNYKSSGSKFTDDVPPIGSSEGDQNKGSKQTESLDSAAKRIKKEKNITYREAAKIAADNDPTLLERID